MANRVLATFLATPLLLPPGPVWPGAGDEPMARELTPAGSIPVPGVGVSLYQGGFECDADGNVLFTPAGPLPAPPAPPVRALADTAVRVSADGQTVTRFRLRSVPLVSRFDDRHILRAAFDAEGGVHLLAGAGGRQYVISFARNGRYERLFEIDASEIFATSFAAFDDGALLLAGPRPRDPDLADSPPRIAVQAVPDGGIEDVRLDAEPAPAVPGTLSAEQRMTLAGETALALGPDGNVYFARLGSSGPLYVISASGRVSRHFRLATPKPGAQLSSLRISADRVAAVYLERVPSPENIRHWIAIHDRASGAHLATYGPVSRHVLCYRSRGGLERFSLLGGHRNARGNQNMVLLEATAPALSTPPAGEARAVQAR